MEGLWLLLVSLTPVELNLRCIKADYQEFNFVTM